MKLMCSCGMDLTRKMNHVTENIISNSHIVRGVNSPF